jgi:hypothetical protein
MFILFYCYLTNIALSFMNGWTSEINPGWGATREPSCLSSVVKPQRGHCPPAVRGPPPMAKHLLSRFRLVALHRPILPPALTRFLSGDPPVPKTREPEDKAKKAAVAAATAVVVEASAKSRRENAEVSSREGSDEDDEDTGLPWKGWRPDVAWLSRALEPALHLYKQYNWKPFTCTSPAPLTALSHFIINHPHQFDSVMFQFLE